MNLSGAITVSPPPEKQYAAQAWVGFSSDDRYTIWLQLAPDGRGSGVVLYYNDPPERFEVSAWRLEHYDLHLSARFLGPTLQEATLVGVFKASVLSYTTTGPRDEGTREMMNAPPTELPGPLELDLTIGTCRIRFGAWPEAELAKRLESLRKASLPPSGHR
jgi:hypothetical protein